MGDHSWKGYPKVPEIPVREYAEEDYSSHEMLEWVTNLLEQNNEYRRQVAHLHQIIIVLLHRLESRDRVLPK